LHLSLVFWRHLADTPVDADSPWHGPLVQHRPTTVSPHAHHLGRYGSSSTQTSVSDICGKRQSSTCAMADKASPEMSTPATSPCAVKMGAAELA